jgi:hypothetical protein
MGKSMWYPFYRMMSGLKSKFGSDVKERNHCLQLGIELGTLNFSAY